MNSRSFAFSTLVLTLLAALTTGCGDDTTSTEDAGSQPGMDAGVDSSKDDKPIIPVDGGEMVACIGVVPVTCDGPEDCASGKQCCAVFAGAGYEAFQCADSCAALAADGGIASEICHDGQACEDEGYTCMTSAQYLPTFLARCRDTGEPISTPQPSEAAGEVSCGKDVCGAGEHCCMRTPKDPYCAPTSYECTCEDPPKFSQDAGVHDDAGADAG